MISNRSIVTSLSRCVTISVCGKEKNLLDRFFIFFFSFRKIRRPNGSSLNGLKLERRCHPRLIPASFNNSGIHRELDEACKHKCERDAWPWRGRGWKGMDEGKGSRGEVGERERERESHGLPVWSSKIFLSARCTPLLNLSGDYHGAE